MGRGSKPGNDVGSALLYGAVTPRRRAQPKAPLASTLANVYQLFSSNPAKYQHAEDRELGKGPEACAITSFGLARDSHPADDIKGRKRVAREAAEHFEGLAEGGLLELVEESTMPQTRRYRLTATGLDYARQLSAE